MALALIILATFVSPLQKHVPHWKYHIPCDKKCHQVKHMKKVVNPFRAKLIRMAYCESTGRWFINTGNGYYGGLQFTKKSWRGVGGKGYPHHASKLEQMFRAVKLSRLQGWGAWPICQYA